MHSQAAFQLLLGVLCLLSISVALAQLSQEPIVPGSCSKACTNRNNNDRFSSFLSHCSCSASCETYGDCCYDSPFRTRNHKPRPEVACLTVSGKGQFKFVTKCSKEWDGSSEFCSTGIGHLPPVTSRRTGTSYANYYCALCNEDAQNVITWDSEVRCCPEHDSNSENSALSYVYSENHLWSIMNTDSDVPKRCLCRLHLLSDEFIKQIELRRCESRFEIDTCSFSWTDQDVRNKCKSYQDLVFLDNKIYRNVHCAQCNYQSMAKALCRPPLVEKMIQEGKTESEIRRYCEERQLTDCVSFFGGGKGHPVAISDMFTIGGQRSCIPPPGKRCCEGMKWDFRSKLCVSKRKARQN